MIVLALDPGYDRLGIAVVAKETATERVIHSECFTTEKTVAHERRLALVAEKLFSLITTHTPDSVVTEKLYFSKNKKTALRVAEVRGVILSVTATRNIPFFEYSPAAIKIAITGHGGSDKKQMLAMVPRLLAHQRDSISRITSDDEIDAIAIALTHLASHPRG